MVRKQTISDVSKFKIQNREESRSFASHAFDRSAERGTDYDDTTEAIRRVERMREKASTRFTVRNRHVLRNQTLFWYENATSVTRFPESSTQEENDLGCSQTQDSRPRGELQLCLARRRSLSRARRGL